MEVSLTGIYRSRDSGLTENLDRDGRGGGVLVYLSEELKGMRRPDLEIDDNMEIVWLQVKVKRKHILIGNVYRPPGARDIWLDSLVVMMERAVQEQMPVVVMGDFNCNTLNPDSYTTKLIEVMAEYGLGRRLPILLE